MRRRLRRAIRWLFGPLSLVVMLAVAGLGVALPAPQPALASSPTWSIWYPSPLVACQKVPGLDACINPTYSIQGSGAFVQIFYRTVYDYDVINADVVTRMCGPTFGCVWTGHGMDPGQTLNLTIAEYRNMPAGNYTFQLYLPGYPVTGATFSVS